MKFAFSTVSCPKWDFETIVTRAREYGYDGVEVRAVGAESQLIFDNPARVQALFDAGGIKIVCLASSIAMQQGGRGWRFWRESPNDRSAAELRTYLDAAHRLHCPLVKIFDSQVRPGQDRGSAGVALGATYCKLGEGDVPVEKFITRLMGIGYNGYVTVEWEKAWLPGLAEPEEILPDSIQKLRKWAAAEGADSAGTESDAEPAAAVVAHGAAIS